MYDDIVTAVRNGDYEVIADWLASNPRPAMVDRALELAVNSGDVSAVQMLLPQSRRREYVLVAAVEQDETPQATMVDLLVRGGVAPSLAALVRAIRLQRVDALNVLIPAAIEANPDVLHQPGVVTEAVRTGNADLAYMILAEGFVVDDGAVAVAADTLYDGDLRFMEMLLERDDVHVSDYAVYAAAEAGYDELAARLESRL